MMSIINALAETFAITQFDVMYLGGMLLLLLLSYYFISLHRIYEAAFGAMVGLGIYILLHVLLLGNNQLWTEGGLFPFVLSVFFVSIAVYLVFILPILFSLHWGLIVSEPSSPILYTIQYLVVAAGFFFVMSAVLIYNIEQSYLFHIWNIFAYFKDVPFYTESVRSSWIFDYIMKYQHVIVPLAVVLMLYKLLLANLVSAAVLSIWYNLSHVGFYRQREDGHYRVEFHEVGGHSGGDGGHDDHHAPAAPHASADHSSGHH